MHHIISDRPPPTHAWTPAGRLVPLAACGRCGGLIVAAHDRHVVGTCLACGEVVYTDAAGGVLE
jgi:hypothetical protein